MRIKFPAALLLLLVCFGCGAWLSIHLGRESVRTQVRNELQSYAGSALAQVDEQLAERRTDVHVWAGMEAMEDVRTHDRDLRIETLLLHLQHEYAGAYREFTVLDSSRTVVASTRVGRIDSPLDLDPLAASGQTPPPVPVREGLIRVDGRSVYGFATPIRSRLRNENIGWFVALVDWRVVEQKLRDTPVLDESGDAGRFLVLADASGRILAGPPELAQRAGVDSAFIAQLGNGRKRLAETPGTHACVAACAAGRAGSPAQAWRMVALHDKKRAFAVVEIFERGVFVALLLGLAVALVAARSFRAMASELADARGRQQAASGKEELLILRSQFLSQVSHELRTPVTAILNYTDILRDTSMPATAQERSEFLDVVYDQSRRLMHLINDLLDTAKMEAGTFQCTMQDVELPPVIQRTVGAVRRVAAEKGVQLTVETPATLPLVRADAERVEQVLSNLLNNAVKFTPADGRIAVCAEMTRSRHGIARMQSPAAEAGAHATPPFSGLESGEAEREQYVVVSVQDTGTGIPAADRLKIFDQFVQLGAPTSGRRGAGLGLTIAANIVVQHEGAIWVDGEPGQGSTFRFSLPVVGAAVRVPRTACGQWNQ